MFVLITEADKK